MADKSKTPIPVDIFQALDPRFRAIEEDISEIKTFKTNQVEPMIAKGNAIAVSVADLEKWKEEEVIPHIKDSQALHNQFAGAKKLLWAIVVLLGILDCDKLADKWNKLKALLSIAHPITHLNNTVNASSAATKLKP